MAEKPIAKTRNGLLFLRTNEYGVAHVSLGEMWVEVDNGGTVELRRLATNNWTEVVWQNVDVTIDHMSIWTAPVGGVCLGSTQVGPVTASGGGDLTITPTPKGFVYYLDEA